MSDAELRKAARRSVARRRAQVFIFAALLALNAAGTIGLAVKVDGLAQTRSEAADRASLAALRF